MVKKIKFNLIIDNNPVRDLEGLRNNFNIDDVLRYYNNSLLKKWLEVRGYSDILTQVESISCQNDLETVKELVKIFKIEIDSNQLEEDLYSIKYHKRWQEIVNSSIRNEIQYQRLIKGYCDSYDKLLQNILDNRDNMPLIKSSMRQISENYLGIFKHHLQTFFDDFIEESPLSIFASLMNPVLRREFLSSISIQEKIDKFTNEIVYGCPDSFFYEEYKINKLSELTYNFNTQNEWTQVQPPNQKCLVVEITNRDDVKVTDAKTDIEKAKLASENIKIASENMANIAKNSDQAVGKVFDGLEVSSNSTAYVKYIAISEQTYSSFTGLAKKEIIHRKLFHTLGIYLKTFKGDTNDYWDVIESKGKKFMIIGMKEGNFVRSAGKDGEKLSADDVNEKFPILDGIDYMSRNPDHEIGYLEV